MNTKWYYQVMGEVRGPFDQTSFRRLVDSNEINRDTFVRRDDEDWTIADHIEGLFGQLELGRTDTHTRWYFQVMGEVRGPVGTKALRRLAARNDITRDTFVRRNNEEWVTADHVQGLLR